MAHFLHFLPIFRRKWVKNGSKWVQNGFLAQKKDTICLHQPILGLESLRKARIFVVFVDCAMEPTNRLYLMGQNDPFSHLFILGFESKKGNLPVLKSAPRSRRLRLKEEHL